MALFRFHGGGGLANSLKDTVIVKTPEELEEKILKWESEIPMPSERKAIRILPYTFDERIGWHTQIVEILFFKRYEDALPYTTWVVGYLSEPF